MIPTSKSRAPVLGTVLMAVFLVFVLTSTPAGATSIPAASNANSSWSYGVVKTITVPIQPGSNGWLYGGNATFGYTVTIYENTTSPTTFELTVYRTMGLAYTIRFCDNSCSTPTQWANQTFRVYEATATFANFTTEGQVLQNGTTEVPAIALQNTTSFLHANVTESTDVFLPGAGQRGPHLGYLGANLVAKSMVEFTPALGLIPVQLRPNSTWNSTSAFKAQGAASWSYYYAIHRPAGAYTVGPVSGGGTLSANGTVSVEGAYPAGSTFQYGGSAYPAVELTIIGPFDVREGVVFVPTSVDVFGSTPQPWGNNQTGTASAQTATLDLKSDGGDRLQPIASTLKYSSAAANAASSASIDPTTSGPSVATATGNPVTSGTLQGVPETAEQANGTQACLTSGSSCPLLGGATPRSLVGLIVIGGVVLTVGVVVALAVVSRRRNSPPPVYPNAVLYPPGAAYPSAPAGTPASPAPPPPPEEDPLDHLW